MSEEWMKAAVWGLVTLAMLIVLWSSWRTYRADQAKLQKLQDFRERYGVEMTQLYRWFASDECALMVLDWLDLQLAGGDLRPDGSRRLEVAIHGLQAVRQAVRDSHFNDRCRGAADASCAMSASVPNQPRVTPEQMAELRRAYLEGVELDVFMALCLNQLLEGRTVKVISERREYLNPRPELAPFDRISEPVVRRIVNDLGEQVWPCAEDTFAVEAVKDGEPFPRHVQVVYEVVEPTVDEKVDEVLRLVRFVSKVERETIRAVFLRNGFTIKEGQTDLKPYVYAAAEELLSIARTSWQSTQSVVAVVPDALREAVEYLDDNPFNEIGAGSILHRAMRDALAAAPAQPAAQGEFGDAYQGAREDLAIWKRRALEAEEKLRQQGSIIDHLTLEAQGETRMGEPHIAQGQQVEWRTTAVMLEQANAGLAQLNGKLRAELSALKAQQEPVAWRVTGAGGLTVTPEYPKWAEDDSRLLIESLYTAPQPAPSQDVAGWIPVTERLPEVETDVLVRGVRRNEVMHRVAGLFNGEWSSQETEDLLLGEVTHWMPLPAAPAAHDKQSGVE